MTPGGTLTSRCADLPRCADVPVRIPSAPRCADVPVRIPSAPRCADVPVRIPSGLTLLEMLVVLALVALLGTLIVQGMSFFLARYDTAQRVARDATQAGLQQHWFASSVEGMVPYRHVEFQFRGNAAAFTGVTIQPLGAESGMPVRARWAIDDDGVESFVTYHEDAAPTNDGGLSWPVLRTADPVAFQYAGADGTWLDAWPPRETDDRIPRMVRLVSSAGVVWLAQLDLFPEPVANYSEP